MPHLNLQKIYVGNQMTNDIKFYKTKVFLIDKTKWFSKWWYQYLFENNTGLRNVICRIKGHQDGIIFYSAGGLEPDNHCSNCGENLG